jgi:predicted metalloendopeptidase
MKSKKNFKKKVNKTKRNKNNSVLTDKPISINEVINEYKGDFENNKINKNITNYFLKNNTKISNYLIKNDYYSYINNFWIQELAEKTEMKYLIKLDNFRITQYKVYDLLNELVLKYIKDNNNIIGLELNNFYNSCYKLNPVESSKDYLKKLVGEIDLLRKDRNNLWKMLAIVNKLEITNPFGPFRLEFAPDRKDLSKYIYYMNPHSFAIFDLSVYKDTNFDDTEKNEYNKKYKKFFLTYLNKLFKTTLPDDKLLNPNETFLIGRKYFKMMFDKDNKLIDITTQYNKISSEDAMNLYRFNWVEYCKELGYKSENIPKYFVVTNLNYFKKCTELLLNEWNSDSWRSYWIWLFSRFVARLTKGWHDIFYTFYGKQVQGIQESIEKTRTHVVMYYCSYGFNSLLNNIYIDKSYNETNIFYATNLANNLKQILINKINRNTSMDNKTKKYALLKVQQIELQIGTKKFSENYNEILPLLNFNPDEFIDNFIKINNWRHNLRINNNIDIIKTLSIVDFTTYPVTFNNLASYLVNARYSKTENKLELSTAYLQKPFINLTEYGNEYNLALIGFTIAHEISHSIDNIVKKNIEKEIIKQYKVFSKFDNLNYDASNTIKEDIADISALNICEEYLRDFCIQQKYSPLLILLHFKMFYSYYAYQMRQNISKVGIKFELIKNPHPIDKYRTNVSLSRSSFFQSLFDIKKSDKMYWKDTNPIF